MPPPNLSPTESLTETMGLLKDVLTCHDASVIPLDARKADYSRVSILVVVAVLFVCSFFCHRDGFGENVNITTNQTQN